MEYIQKAVDLIGFIFDLVSKILVAVNGEDSEEVKELEETGKMVNDIAAAVEKFGDDVKTIA